MYVLPGLVGILGGQYVKVALEKPFCHVQQLEIMSLYLAFQSFRMDALYIQGKTSLG
jgi:hypothetical protein